MSDNYKIGFEGIFPYIELENYVIHIMTNIDLEQDTEMDFCITAGKICSFRRENIPQKDLADLIRSGKIYSKLTNSKLVSLIEKNQNKILHFIENHEEYLRGPPYPDYESIKD
jgi:hypothetical protein